MRSPRLVAIWSLPLLGALVAGRALSRTSTNLYPRHAGRIYCFGDRERGGSSWTTTQVRGGVLVVVLELSSRYRTPYTGFGIPLNDPDHPQGVDFTSYDRLEIDMRSPTMRHVGYSLVTWIPGFTRPEKPLSALYHEGGGAVAPMFSKVVVPFSSIPPAVWWPEEAGVGASTVATRMDLVKNIEIKAPVSSPPPRSDTLEIRSIDVVGTTWWPLGILVAVGFCLSGLLTWRLGRARPEPAATPWPTAGVPDPSPPGRFLGDRAGLADVAGEKVDLPNRRDLELQVLLQWMARNYHREGLGVEEASRETGVPVRKIPKLLFDHGGKRFPACIAELRIREACRLLRETDRQVGEISLAVGYSNISHFHRVFKAETGTSPAQWRQGPEPG